MAPRPSLFFNKGRNSVKAIFKYKTLYFMMLPILAYFLIFSFYPLARGLVISIQDYRLIGDRPLIGIDNYLSVLKDPVFGKFSEYDHDRCRKLYHQLLVAAISCALLK